MEWEHIFEEAIFEKGATEQQIHELTQGLQLPLSQKDIEWVKQNHVKIPNKSASLESVILPFDITKWELPSKTLPQSFLSFLRFSNGGYCRNGERRFENFFGTSEIREMFIAYEFPEYMPHAVPFAFDGGGCFYIFDMRNDPINDEFPILFSCAGNLGYAESVWVAPSFHAACIGTTNPRDKGISEEDEILYELILIQTSASRLRILSIIREITKSDLYTARRIIDTPNFVILRGKEHQVTPVKTRFETAGAVVKMVKSTHHER